MECAVYRSPLRIQGQWKEEGTISGVSVSVYWMLFSCILLVRLFLAKTTSYAREARHTISKIWKQHSMNSHGNPWYQLFIYIYMSWELPVERPKKRIIETKWQLARWPPTRARSEPEEDIKLHYWSESGVGGRGRKPFNIYIYMYVCIMRFRCHTCLCNCSCNFRSRFACHVAERSAPRMSAHYLHCAS